MREKNIPVTRVLEWYEGHIRHEFLIEEGVIYLREMNEHCYGNPCPVHRSPLHVTLLKRWQAGVPRILLFKFWYRRRQRERKDISCGKEQVSPVPGRMQWCMILLQVGPREPEVEWTYQTAMRGSTRIKCSTENKLIGHREAKEKWTSLRHIFWVPHNNMAYLLTGVLSGKSG